MHKMSRKSEWDSGQNPREKNTRFFVGTTKYSEWNSMKEQVKCLVWLVSATSYDRNSDAVFNIFEFSKHNKWWLLSIAFIWKRNKCR